MAVNNSPDKPSLQVPTPRTDDVFAMFSTLLNAQHRETISYNIFEAIGETVKERMGQLERKLAEAERNTLLMMADRDAALAELAKRSSIGEFDPVKFYRAFPAGGNTDRGDWLRRCLTAMCEEAVRSLPSATHAPLLAEARRLIGNSQPLVSEGSEEYRPWLLDARAWCAKVDALSLSPERKDIE